MKVAGGGEGGGGEKGAFYLYEPSLAEGSDWWQQRCSAEAAAASRWSSVQSLGRRSTPERNVLMQDWTEID